MAPAHTDSGWRSGYVSLVVQSRQDIIDGEGRCLCEETTDLSEVRGDVWAGRWNLRRAGFGEAARRG